MINAMTLQVNGNGLTLSEKLWHEMEEVAPDLIGDGTPLDARALAAVVARRKTTVAAPIVLASVFPYSVQNYMLRLWLSSGGLDPIATSAHRRAAAAYRGLHVGRRDRRLLRRRAVGISRPRRSASAASR